MTGQAATGLTTHVFSETVTTVTEFTYPLTGLTTGTQYLARVRASNVHGLGYYGSAASEKPMGVPGVPLVTAITLSGTSIKIVWDKPATNGDEITQYLLQWDNSATFAGLANPALLASQQYHFSQSLGATTHYFHNVIGLAAVRIVETALPLPQFACGRAPSARGGVVRRTFTSYIA